MRALELTNTVPVGSLSAQQLSQLKKQLDSELEHLTQSFQSLRQAQAKFKDCLKTINTTFVPSKADAPILVPLTSSLYVPGKLADVEKVIVDVGTGFYVEKNKSEAKEFYDDKVKKLEASLIDLEKVIQGKGQSLGVIEDAIRQKVMQQQQQGDGAAAAASPAS